MQYDELGVKKQCWTYRGRYVQSLGQMEKVMMWGWFCLQALPSEQSLPDALLLPAVHAPDYAATRLLQQTRSRFTLFHFLLHGGEVSDLRIWWLGIHCSRISLKKQLPLTNHGLITTTTANNTNNDDDNTGPLKLSAQWIKRSWLFNSLGHHLALITRGKLYFSLPTLVYAIQHFNVVAFHSTFVTEDDYQQKLAIPQKMLSIIV